MRRILIFLLGGLDPLLRRGLLVPAGLSVAEGILSMTDLAGALKHL